MRWVVLVILATVAGLFCNEELRKAALRKPVGVVVPHASGQGHVYTGAKGIYIVTPRRFIYWISAPSLPVRAIACEDFRESDGQLLLGEGTEGQPVAEFCEAGVEPLGDWHPNLTTKGKTTSFVGLDGTVISFRLDG